MMKHAVCWSMAMFHSVVAVSRDSFKGSHKHGKLPSQTCQLTPYHAEQSTTEVDFEFLFATTSDDTETVEHFLRREINEHIFDCLSIEESNSANVQQYDLLPKELQSYIFSRKERSMKAQEMGIISLTVLGASQGM